MEPNIREELHILEEAKSAYTDQQAIVIKLAVDLGWKDKDNRDVRSAVQFLNGWLKAKK